ncbi:DEAD H helicase [Crepidotus variabilis]|uniref:DEAD H helicase n=1 Tax=Crepidotus variabilis TaxID=179855 RepID=A0A9P6EP73_9AGAR|nr:DEAD H helicase [Crepidotus variabilis]
MAPKRKTETVPAPAKKQRRAAKNTSQNSSTVPDTTEWPQYFQELYRTFKAINTVLAFVSSKRHLATSFSAVRSSVENILKHPLEISKVSEIKALLPDLLKFSYIPPSELEAPPLAKNGASSVDYSRSLPNTAPSSKGHVLVLDFQEDRKGKKTTIATQGSNAAPPTMSPAAVKKLIESRNAQFVTATNELISAATESEDAVQLVIMAGRNYVPVDHTLPLELDETHRIPNSNERASIEDILAGVMQEFWYVDQIAHRRTVAAKDPQIGSLAQPISETIEAAVLQARNVQTLYTHQTAAIDAIQHGRNVVVSTSTASGKSMIYQIPLLTFLEEDKSNTAMLIFPTKALAQDQKVSLEHILLVCPGMGNIKVATYDGDTAQELRATIRDTASIILTNFDTLHASILPQEEKWRGFLKCMKILAVDELHYYTGMLGSHVAQILRRFRRVCAAVGNRRIRFVSCSATLANPADFMSNMFALDLNELDVISNDGSPSGQKEYVIWNPPLLEPTHPAAGRKSTLSEASKLMRYFMKKGIKVILFCKIRKTCELAMKTIKADLSNEGRLDILDMVRAYRGGYTREDRRRIEQEAFSGQLLGIIATNALELGIDIGALDAVIMLGFPFTVSNFQQQAGRAGRRSRDSLAIMMADPFPVDQHYVQNPDDLFEHTLDDLILDTDNEVILEAHLQCAGYEMPLRKEDEKWFGTNMMTVCNSRLRRDDEGWYHTHPKFLPFPSSHVAIRGAQEDKYMVVEVRDNAAQYSTHTLEEIEFSRALFELYEGGVFMHQGESFIVSAISHNDSIVFKMSQIREVSHDDKIAKVERTDVNYITSPRDFTRVEPLQTHKTRSIEAHFVHFGRLNVRVQVFGFFKMRGGAIIDAVELMTPPFERESTGFWIDLPSPILNQLFISEIDGAAAIHAAEHALLNQFALSRDMKTDCRVAKEDYLDGVKVTRPPRLIFFDAAGKSGGIAARAFDHVHILFERAQERVNNCPCEDGCISCIQSTSCKDANLISSKRGAGIILNGLLIKKAYVEESESK